MSGRSQRILDIGSLVLAGLLIGMAGLNVLYGIGERHGLWLDRTVAVGGQ